MAQTSKTSRRRPHTATRGGNLRAQLQQLGRNKGTVTVDTTVISSTAEAEALGLASPVRVSNWADTVASPWGRLVASASPYVNSLQSTLQEGAFELGRVFRTGGEPNSSDESSEENDSEEMAVLKHQLGHLQDRKRMLTQPPENAEQQQHCFGTNKRSRRQVRAHTDGCRLDCPTAHC